MSGQVQYSGYRFLHGFQVKMKGSAVTMRFLGCIRVRSYESASIGGHPGDWREQAWMLKNWDQVDFDRGFIYLEMTKNGSDRYVHLNKSARAALMGLQKERKRLGLKFETLFFDHRHQPIKDPSEWFEVACNEANVEGVTWHILRHTFASRLVMAGVHLRTVQDLMGHKTAAMTARYAHLAPTHLKTALGTLDLGHNDRIALSVLDAPRKKKTRSAT